ncbi:hypothetical protein AAFF_G00088250 [Aldrovandia affinis]|uniref:Uncharacterized protein n=1 Tax=Aldrovandia affinis TaxID=143900 RepID=A0AAD7RWL6_9TELE|nr:hypothetical protein AAFF_G00088250 [Aldrovandia affinis]
MRPDPSTPHFEPVDQVLLVMAHGMLGQQSSKPAPSSGAWRDVRRHTLNLLQPASDVRAGAARVRDAPERATVCSLRGPSQTAAEASSVT